MNLSLNPKINIRKLNFTCTTPFKNNFKGAINTCEDTFIRTTTITENPFETDKRKFEISDYKALSKKEIEEIKTKYCTEKEKEIAKRDVKLAIEFKKYLDKKYGEEKYIFECIGTSPSTIARVLEFMGVETHYLPISNLRMFNTVEQACYNKINKDEKGKESYSKFLKEQGINKEKIENSDKTYLFYDYAATGRSIEIFRGILENCFNIPVNNKNVEFKSLNSDFTYLFYYKTADDGSISLSDSIEESYCYKFLKEELEKCGAANYGGIPHLSFTELEKIGNLQNRITDSSAKSYNFLVMDELNEMGLLKENELNKDSL